MKSKVTSNYSCIKNNDVILKFQEKKLELAYQYEYNKDT